MYTRINTTTECGKICNYVWAAIVLANMIYMWAHPIYTRKEREEFRRNKSIGIFTSAMWDLRDRMWNLRDGITRHFADAMKCCYAPSRFQPAAKKYDWGGEKSPTGERAHLVSCLVEIRPECKHTVVAHKEFVCGIPENLMKSTAKTMPYSKQLYKLLKRKANRLFA